MRGSSARIMFVALSSTNSPDVNCSSSLFCAPAASATVNASAQGRRILGSKERAMFHGF
jgi:hypothetical protein